MVAYLMFTIVFIEWYWEEVSSTVARRSTTYDFTVDGNIIQTAEIERNPTFAFSSTNQISKTFQCILFWFLKLKPNHIKNQCCLVFNDDKLYTGKTGASVEVGRNLNLYWCSGCLQHSQTAIGVSWISSNVLDFLTQKKGASAVIWRKLKFC